MTPKMDYSKIFRIDFNFLQLFMEIPNKHISFKKLQCPFVCHFFVVCTGTGLGGLLRVIGGGVVVMLLVGMVVRVPPPPLGVLSPLNVCSPF